MLSADSARGGIGGRTIGGVTELLRCEIFAADLDATADFYTRVLWFEITRDQRDQAWGYLALRRGEVRLEAARRAVTAAAEHRKPPVGVELVLEGPVCRGALAL